MDNPFSVASFLGMQSIHLQMVCLGVSVSCHTHPRILQGPTTCSTLDLCDQSMLEFEESCSVSYRLI